MGIDLRRWKAAGLFFLVVLIAAGPACKRKAKARASTPESPAVLLSVVNVADPAGTVQLASGFFGLESDAWRWTARKFTVVLRPPEGASKNGARLELHLNVPAVVVNRVGPIAVSAEIGGTVLPAERYERMGDYVYARDIDSSLLRASAVAIRFSTDKALPPAGADTRELALIVTSVGLAEK